MRTKIIIVTFIIGTSLLLAGCANSIKEKKAAHGKDETYVTVKTHQLSDSTWGYDILADGKPVIRQDIVPVLSGIHHFHTEAEARKTGERVIYNLKNKQTPSLDSADLKATGILR